MARKKIHIITPHYTPEITAAAFRMESAAKSLSASFHVRVFTLNEPGSREGKRIVRFNDNLFIHYLPSLPYNKSRFFFRALFEWLNALRLIRHANREDADLAIITIPFMFLLPVAARFCRTRKRIADVRDIVWHYLSTGNFARRFFAARITAWMHRSLQKFDAITLTNEAEKQWLIRHALIDENKVRVIPNGISEDKFKRLSNVVYRPRSDKFTITYLGNIGSSQFFIPLIDAVNSMEGVQLELVGNGNQWKILGKYLEATQNKNVTLFGKLNWQETISYYKRSNLLFASLKDEFDTAIPSKLYEYLATGLPILYLGSGAAANFLDNFNQCYITSVSEPGHLRRLIDKIRKQEYTRSTKNILVIRRNFLREKLSMRYTELAALLLNEPEKSGSYVNDILTGFEKSRG